VQPFGLFVDIGAERDGLLHASELAGAAGLQPGDRLELVVVKGVRDGRLSLTLQRAPPPPSPREAPGWRAAVESAPPTADGGASDAGSISAFSALTSASRAPRAAAAPSSCLSSRPPSRASSRASSAVPDVERAAAVAALQKEVDACAASRLREGQVRSLTKHGAFVRLTVSNAPPADADAPLPSVDELLRTIAAEAGTAGRGAATATPLAQLRTRTTILSPPLCVDGLVSATTLEAAYRRGYIDAAGTINGLAAGQRVRVRVEDFDIEQRRVTLSLCAPRTSAPPAGRLPTIADLTDRTHTSTSEAFPSLEAAASRSVRCAAASATADLPTLALPTPILVEPSRPLPTPPISEPRPAAAEELTTAASRLANIFSAEAVHRPQCAAAKVLIVRTLKRCGNKRPFRTLKLVDMPWKDDPLDWAGTDTPWTALAQGA